MEYATLPVLGWPERRCYLESSTSFHRHDEGGAWWITAGPWAEGRLR